MSIQLIQQYHAQVEKIIRYGGTRKETAVRKPFHDLLEQYARQKNLELIGELDYRTGQGQTIIPDGTLKDALRQDWGYWEAKDEADDLDTEIKKKFAKGYPCNNILFEDTQTAVLYQACQEVGRVDFRDAANLDALLTRFVSYESREVREFREAIENFTRDIPDLGEMLRAAIREQYDSNQTFQKAAKEFLELCQEAINPSMEMADVREMIVQHVLTEDIFITVFDEPQFHRENIIAHELGEVVGTFYKGQVRRQIDGRIEGYTRAIKARAAQIYNHQEKQKFLKVLYENFYKAYNPKAADRLGIVYTPNEIVRFMIEAADHLCYRHFGKGLGDKGVEILDPATGTGTFVTEIIEYLPPHQLAYKYQHELHCNEVAILPYYIANLNIEYTYKQKMGQYVPFENIVFVDTLDNMGFRTQYVRQLGLFGLTDENLERIERQNQREISIIIGNPPYNANQKNENENNKNREYPAIDKRIKETYIKASTAQKTKLYDMYTRFYRWAADRIGQDGIIAFVTNRSFLDARGFDGFRKLVAEEFSHIYIVDLGGDVRKNPKLSGPKHNVFAIQTGVALAFMVRKQEENEQPCKIWYVRRPEMEEARDKLRFLATNPLSKINFEVIKPGNQNYWLNVVENDWDTLLPTVPMNDQDGIFHVNTLGFSTNRDEWVIDFDANNLAQKIRFFIEKYNEQIKVGTNKNEIDDSLDYSIKWSSTLKSKLLARQAATFDQSWIVEALYRPFFKVKYYADPFLSDRLTALHQTAFGQNLSNKNQVIIFRYGTRLDFFASASSVLPNLNFYSLDPVQCLPLYRYDDLDHRHDNITDWALGQFRARYPQTVGAGLVPAQDAPAQDASTATRATTRVAPTGGEITKQDIFHYVYAVLHHPAYRAKYKLNLKRDFPRIPFYDDFWQWAAWGEQLMALHLNYETIDPYPLQRTDLDPDATRQAYRAKLKADKPNGVIELDTYTTLSGVPPAAWEYKLGNRTAVEWVLDRYKERKPKDPTIREKFNTYRFVDYKEDVVDLLRRVTTVSVETMKIISQFPGNSEFPGK
ncbi:MAG: N-6 DNA methylase [Ardenticatenaceae bacterium]|nr:N-6 DNA methylase [Ardenticatenaceae bacterium]MCB9442698.1 N-6 DNA methylase [Ardenticatenaceae bacterium]